MTPQRNTQAVKSKQQRNQHEGQTRTVLLPLTPSCLLLSQTSLPTLQLLHFFHSNDQHYQVKGCWGDLSLNLGVIDSGQDPGGGTEKPEKTRDGCRDLGGGTPGPLTPPGSLGGDGMQGHAPPGGALSAGSPRTRSI